MSSITPRSLKLFGFLAVFAVFSCSDDDEPSGFRNKVSYSQLTPETEYSKFFKNDAGVSTVDLTDGNNRLKMFQALHYQSSNAIAKRQHIDADSLNAQFEGTKFKDIPSMSIVGIWLSSTGLELRNVTASSLSDVEQAAVYLHLEDLFEQIEEASHAFERENYDASNGVNGVVINGNSTYLVDEKGIELIQVIQKSLIGALQLDYIGNVLLDDGLTANNSKLVEGKNYTLLEHNWDVAYGLLTYNDVYLKGWTTTAKGTQSEIFGGSYIWEYRRNTFQNVYPAFLKGRAAIVNNDMAEVKKQARLIRTEFELAIANAALGYLAKTKDGGATEASRIHAFGEGLGFIYSLRFAALHDANAEFSDDIIAYLLESGEGFWGLDPDKITEAENAIKAKFKL